ncbi:MAG: AAA family ATPase [Mucilaginibacter sp.]
MYHTADRPLLIEMIRSESDAYNQRAKKAGKFGQVPEKDPAKNMFKIYSANHWMDIEKNTPVPKMLFGEFWYEGELCILFADTNMGKSILAVQLGNSISRCEPIDHFAVHADPSNVLYIDFELSAKQFELRYTDNGRPYDFGNGFFRAEFNPLAQLPYNFKDFDDYISSALEYAVKRTGADVLIIDNITCLRSGTEYASEALALMKHLKTLKTKHQLSILVLAHTPKRNPANPITRNDLGGSKMLINFADSAFAIGQSHSLPDHRYLKQIKQRSGGETYGADNVCLCRLEQRGSLLRHVFTGNAREADHLCHPTVQERERTAAKVAELHAAGLSQREIAAKLKMGLATVNKMVNWAREGS